MYSSHGNGDILTSLFSVQLISKGVCIKLCLDEYIIISASQWEWLRDVESRQDEEDVAVFPLWDDIICWWMFPPQDECMCACVLGCTVGWCGLCECDYARCVVLKYAHTSPIPIHLCYLALLLQLIYNVWQPFLHIPHDAHTHKSNIVTRPGYTPRFYAYCTERAKCQGASLTCTKRSLTSIFWIFPLPLYPFTFAALQNQIAARLRRCNIVNVWNGT